MFPAANLSFNLAPGVALGDAVRSRPGQARIGMPDSISGNFQGAAQAFQSSLASQPWLILAALVAVYIILGVLYESFVHPLTIISTLPSAGLGALIMLWGCGQDFDHGADRPGAADRHRQEERHPDDRLRPRSAAPAACRPRRRSTRRA
jgi:HAE1 family hydrophobic/amphiphilic exporter-1